MSNRFRPYRMLLDLHRRDEVVGTRIPCSLSVDSENVVPAVTVPSEKETTEGLLTVEVYGSVDIRPQDEIVKVYYRNGNSVLRNSVKLVVTGILPQLLPVAGFKPPQTVQVVQQGFESIGFLLDVFFKSPDNPMFLKSADNPVQIHAGLRT